MGLADVVGGLTIIFGLVSLRCALVLLASAKRSQARFTKLTQAWAAFSIGAGTLFGGAAALRYPHDSWVSWIGLAFNVSVLILLITSSVADMKADLKTASPASDAPEPGSPEPPGADLSPATAGLIARINGVTFSTTRLHPGYDEEEVDEFLDKLVACLSGGGRLDQLQLRDAEFSTTRIRPGYVIADVNGFLAEIAAAAW